MALGLLLDVVNAVGHGVLTTFSTLISLNYVLGQRIVACLSWICSWICSLLLTLFTATKILLEDLLVFLKECSDSAIFVGECLFRGVDAVLAGIHAGITALHGACAFLGQSASLQWRNAVGGAADLGTRIAEFLNLLGASVMLLLNLVPRTLILIWAASLSLSRSLRDAGSQCLSTVRSAPLEICIGLVTGLAVFYLLSRLFRKLFLRTRQWIRGRGITPGRVVRTALTGLAFVYVNFVRGVLFFFGTVFHVMIVSLANVHVPRFHHAGDSDGEDDDGSSSSVDNQGKSGPVIMSP